MNTLNIVKIVKVEALGYIAAQCFCNYILISWRETGAGEKELGLEALSRGSKPGSRIIGPRWGGAHVQNGPFLLCGASCACFMPVLVQPATSLLKAKDEPRAWGSFALQFSAGEPVQAALPDPTPQNMMRTMHI